MTPRVPSAEEQVQLAAQELLARHEARAGLRGFTSYVYPNFVCAPHHQLIIEHLDAMIDGQLEKLMIFMPPRYGKTLLVSQHLPAYYLGRFPDRFAVMASYEQDLAKISGRYVRNLMNSQQYQNVFPGVSVMADSKSAGRFNTPQKGGYFAVGIGGGDGSGLTGRGANLAVVDDPLKNRINADSKTIREGIKSWYQSTLLTRLMDHPRIIVCLTRWHPDDIAGWLLANSKRHEWTVLNLPALARENDLLGRKYDEPLWPRRHTKAQLYELRDNPTKLGAREFEALFQQNPTVPEGNLFKIADFQRWTTGSLPTHFDIECVSCDTGISSKSTADRSVVQHWGKTGARFYLLDQVRGTWNFSQLLTAFKIFCDNRPWVGAKLVERKSNGQAIIDLLTESLPGLIPVDPIGSKGQRAVAILPYVTSKGVFLPTTADAPWVEEFLLETAQFSYDGDNAHDDQVDAMTQAVNYLARQGQQWTDVSSQLLNAFSFGGG